MKPICVPCRRFFRMKKGGFAFIEGMPLHNRAPAGNAAPEQWKPYKAWNGDLWECPDCGAQVISGVAFEPFAEHYKPDFAEKVLRHGTGQLQINDC
jgi:hypothetical protein